MAEIPKWQDQNIDKKLTWLEYKTRPTLQEQLDTVENFREKLKLLRKILEDIRKFVSWDSSHFQTSYWILSARFWIVFKNFDMVTEIISDLKQSKAVITKSEIDDFKILEKHREELLLYINNKSILSGVSASSRLKDN